MTFDTKEKLILSHYRLVLEERTFDEYDLLGFLIFIRRHINASPGSFPAIKDFSDLIAHRSRDKGRVMDSIGNAISNNYCIKRGTQKVKGFAGIQYASWKKEWITLGNAYSINFTSQAILEITLCIFSLSQYTEHKRLKDGSVQSGKIDLYQATNGYLALVTNEGTRTSLNVCFFKAGPFVFETRYEAGHVKEPVETIRVEGHLRLKTSNGYII